MTIFDRHIQYNIKSTMIIGVLEFSKYSDNYEMQRKT